MKSFYIFLIIALGFLSQSVVAQIAYKFSKRADSYPDELKEFMTARIDKSKKKQTLAYLEQFTQFWNSDSISMESKKKIMSYSNLMTRKRMHPFPEFMDYLETLTLVARSDKGSLIFLPWLESMESLLSGRSKTNFIRYLSISRDLFEHNILYKTGCSEK